MTPVGADRAISTSSATSSERRNDESQHVLKFDPARRTSEDLLPLRRVVESAARSVNLHGLLCTTRRRDLRDLVAARFQVILLHADGRREAWHRSASKHAGATPRAGTVEPEGRAFARWRCPRHLSVTSAEQPFVRVEQGWAIALIGGAHDEVQVAMAPMSSRPPSARSIPRMVRRLRLASG